MNKGSSQVLWLLVVAVMAVFIAVLLMYMTHGRTGSFMDFVSDTLNDIYAGFSDITDGGGEETTIESDKETIDWIASQSSEVCAEGIPDSGPPSKTYKFSDKFESLGLDDSKDPIVVAGEWEGGEEYESEMKDCEKVSGDLSKIKGGEKYEITLSEGGYKGVEISFEKMVEEGDIEPEIAIVPKPTKPLNIGEEYMFKAYIFKAGETGYDKEEASYSWSFEGGGSGSKEMVPHTFGEKGKYDVSLTVTYQGKSRTVTQGFQVGEVNNGNRELEADFECPNTGNLDLGDKLSCESQSSAPEGGEIDSHDWKVTLPGGEEKTGSGESFDLKVDKKGEYKVNLTVKSGEGEKDSMKKSYQISFEESPPQVTIEDCYELGEDGTSDLKVGDTLKCEGRVEKGTYDIDGDSKKWKITDPTGGEIAKPGYSFKIDIDNTGSYHIVFNASDVKGNSGSDSVSVEVQNTAPTAKLDYDNENFEVTRVGDKISFDGTSSSDLETEVKSYKWDFGDGETDSGSKVSHTFSSKGTYEVSLTVSDKAEEGKGKSDTKTTEIKVLKELNKETDKENINKLLDIASDHCSRLSSTKTYTEVEDISQNYSEHIEIITISGGISVYWEDGTHENYNVPSPCQEISNKEQIGTLNTGSTYLSMKRGEYTFGIRANDPSQKKAIISGDGVLNPDFEEKGYNEGNLCHCIPMLGCC